MGATCSCFCHTGPYAACDIPGGCGSIGCGRDHKTRTGGCVTCAVVRPDATPRDPHNPPVCDGDRRLIGRWLADINLLHDDLTTPEPPVIDLRRNERWTKDHKGRPALRGTVWNDPIAPLGGMGPTAARNTQPRTSGSRERPIPINTSRHDLTAPARNTGHPGDDQIGHLSAATILDAWVRNIRDLLQPGHHLPDPEVGALAGWLRNRTDLICDQHPDVATYAEALKLLRGALRAAAGQIDPPPQPCDGVTCVRCDQRALFRKPTDTYRAECGNCGTLYTDDEYTTIVKQQAASVTA